MPACDVFAGQCYWSVEQADCLEWLRGLPDASVDLLFTSPPYEHARTYGIGEQMLGGQSWVTWMVEVVKAAAPKVKGLIAINCEGQTRDYNYSGVPFLLFADLKRAGFTMRKPPIFNRVGIPGSGGPDWLRNDFEPVICITRGGKLPWSDNTACGHPPKWAPGGAMAHRLSDGTRVNQWGKTGEKTGVEVHGTKPRSVKAPPSHDTRTKKEHTKRDPDGTMRDQSYTPPVLANPGNKIERLYTASEVAAMLAEAGNVVEVNVGGGQMGHALAHDNEAPFPLELPSFFIRSFCPPGGIVADPFVGSGTTIDAAIQHNRRAIGCDVRQEMVDLTTRRMATVTPSLW